MTMNSNAMDTKELPKEKRLAYRILGYTESIKDAQKLVANLKEYREDAIRALILALRPEFAPGNKVKDYFSNVEYTVTEIYTDGGCFYIKGRKTNKNGNLSKKVYYINDPQDSKGDRFSVWHIDELAESVLY